MYHLAIKNLKKLMMESDTQSALAENKFSKTSDHLLQKAKVSLRHACESKNIIWRWYCDATTKATWEVLAGLSLPLFLISCHRDLSLVSTFLSSLLSILLRKKNLITDGIRWNPIPWFRSLLLPQPKLNKEPFLLSHSHFTSFYRGRGGLMVSALDSGRVVRVRALDGVIVLCS